MSETIYVGIGLIGANIAFLVGYIAYILPETENCVQKRRNELKSKLDTKVDEKYKGKSLGELIVDAFGSVIYHYKETRQIEKWQNVFSHLKNYILSSIVLSLVAISLGIFSSQIDLLKSFYFSEAFSLGSALYFLYLVYYGLDHRAELHKWKVSRK